MSQGDREHDLWMQMHRDLAAQLAQVREDVVGEVRELGAAMERRVAPLEHRLSAVERFQLAVKAVGKVAGALAAGAASVAAVAGWWGSR